MSVQPAKHPQLGAQGYARPANPRKDECSLAERQPEQWLHSEEVPEGNQQQEGIIRKAMGYSLEDMDSAAINTACAMGVEALAAITCEVRHHHDAVTVHSTNCW